MAGPEMFIRGFADNLAAQAAIAEWVDQVAMLGAGAVALRATFHVGGQAISMIYDKSKRMFIKEDFEKLVEQYNLSSFVSMLESPASTPDKSVIEQDEQKTFVAGEVERLNKLHQETIK